MKVIAGFLAVATLLFLAACDQLPRDARGTLAAAREGPLRVGIIENPPWTRYDGGVAGVETELVRQFARELGTEVQWIRGGESDLMPALERFELHLVVGGLTGKTPWLSHVGLSSAYFTNRYVVGSPDGGRLQSLEGRRVAVPQGTALAAIARERGAEVTPVADLSATDVALVAAPAWELGLLGRKPVGIELYREKHVMAVPPGENAFLMRLDRFLAGQKSGIAERLRREAR